jgi:hypothetical protein
MHVTNTTEVSVLNRRSLLVALLGSLLVLGTTAHASQAPTLTPRVYLASLQAHDSCDFPLGTPRSLPPKRLAYLYGGNIYLANDDGTNEQPLTQEEAVSSFAWSSDATRIVFSTGTKGIASIKVIQLASRQVTTVLTIPYDWPADVYIPSLTMSPMVSALPSN